MFFVVSSYTCAIIVPMATAIVDTAIEPTQALDFDDALNDVAGHLNAQHARLIDLAIAMLADDSLWFGDGVHTPEQFLAWRTGLAPNRARQIVAIARRATELPESIDACRRGELAIDQLAAIANRAPWWADHDICDLAKMLTVGQLRKTLANYPFPDIPSPDTDTDAAAGQRRRTGTRRTAPQQQRRRTTRRLPGRSLRLGSSVAKDRPPPDTCGGASATTAGSASTSTATNSPA